MSINTKNFTQESLAEASLPQSSLPSYKEKLSSFLTNVPQALIETSAILKEKFKKSVNSTGNINLLDQGYSQQKNSIATGQHSHFEQSQTLIPSFQAILLTLDEDDRLSLLSKDLIRSVSVLGRGSITEELLKQFFQSLYPCHSLRDFRDALEPLIKLHVIQRLSSSSLDLLCYEIDYQLQDALDQKFCDERQKEIRTHMWEMTKFQLDELIKDQGRHEKGFHLYLDHAISFLRKESFKLLLKGPQRDDILLLLDQLFEKEGFYERALPSPTQYPSHALTSKSSYAHVQQVLTDLRNAYSSLGEHSKVIKCYEKELEIANVLKDRELEMKGYGNLGNTYYSLGKCDQAIQYYNQQLVLALEIKNQPGVGRAYANLGNTAYILGKYYQAIMYHEKDLNLSLEIKDQVGEGRAYNNLGNAYKALGKIYEATVYYEKSLDIALRLKDLVSEGRCYFNIGTSYYELGKFDHAIQYIKKSLLIDLNLRNRTGESKAYAHLGMIYRYLGEYHQAIKYHEKELMIALELRNQTVIGNAYNGLGIIYEELGEPRKAIEYYGKYLTIAQEIRSRSREGTAYGSLGNAHSSLGKYHQAIEYYEKQFIIVKEQGDQIGEGRVSCNLGNAYASLGNSSKAIKYYENDLAIALKIGSQAAEGRAYGNLGRYYFSLNDFPRAMKWYEKQLKISSDIKDHVGKERAYNNLGNIHYTLKNYTQAEIYFRQSIEIAATLQRNAKEAQSQVTIFEQLSTTYSSLEKVLLLQGKDKEALEVADMRRARVLSFLLSQKLLLEKNQEPVIQALSFQNMQELAKKLHTTFIIYSIIPLGEEKIHIHAYIASSRGDSIQSISIPIPDGAFSQLDQIFQTFPYQDEGKRPVRGKKNPNELFKEKLINWYDIFIHPIEPYLPSQDNQETLTFIPDGFLAHLPFGAFYHTQEKQYLIEKYPVSVAPSIQVLSLLDQLPKEFSDQALLIGNPTTPVEEDNNLLHSELELRHAIAPLMNIPNDQVLTQKGATVENVLKYASLAKWIHFACHGISGQKPLDDPHSVFEGFFQLAADIQHASGHLHAKEVNQFVLKADLVFMSACHLGRGNLQKEGSIGPIWSFLGAGARSTIASYWPLPEGDITVKMVKTFYEHYLGKETLKLNKAQALRQAVLMAIKIERDKPRQWGAFFLSGLI
ncbi:MAG: tetratricopeptide repeat protein [Candidatus Rhabdochlamydia sp.]